jgi:hypothetical protein
MNQVGTVTQRTLGIKATKVIQSEASYQDRPALAFRN